MSTNLDVKNNRIQYILHHHHKSHRKQTYHIKLTTSNLPHQTYHIKLATSNSKSTPYSYCNNTNSLIPCIGYKVTTIRTLYSTQGQEPTGDVMVKVKQPANNMQLHVTGYYR